jgi:hypothetical protein
MFATSLGQLISKVNILGSKKSLLLSEFVQNGLPIF